MDIYFDTSAVMKLYVLEDCTDVVAAYTTNRGKPIAIHGLHELEMENTLRLKVFRKEMPERQCREILNRIEKDTGKGFLLRFPVDWPEVYREARRVSSRIAAHFGCRSLDLLHIAAALHWKSKALLSADDRQISAALKMNLKVMDPRRM